jgi:hypothetical protein
MQDGLEGGAEVLRVLPLQAVMACLLVDRSGNANESTWNGSPTPVSPSVNLQRSGLTVPREHMHVHRRQAKGLYPRVTLEGKCRWAGLVSMSRRLGGNMPLS